MNKVKENFMRLLFLFSACVSILALAAICLFLFANGLPGIGKIGISSFLFGSNWSPTSDEYGIFPMIIGSIYATAGAIIIGVPTGVFTAIFLAKFCPDKLYGFFKAIINLLAGIPSVVYGFFGLMVIVPFIRNTFGVSGTSLLAASLVLGIMILPTIIGVSESAIRAVPESYFEGALALGAGKERSIFTVVLPAAKSGVTSSIVLGIGRAIGETMAVVMVAGNQPIIPESIIGGLRTMTANIVLEMGYATDLHREALIATAVVLFIFILLINLCFSAMKRRESI